MGRFNKLVFTAAALCLSAPIQAQLIEEVVVTATKRAKTLQEVPVAVTVTSAETIQQAKIQDVLDLQSVVPTLRVEQRQASRATNFLIRGFGGGTNNLGIEPSVAIFVDGVYRSRSAAAIGDLPKLERVEVLGGPQSTLFGKNASAGVLSVVTPKPTGEGGSFVELGLGNFSAVNFKGLYEGSISDTTAFNLSATVNQRDGYVENPTTGGELNDRDRFALRGQLLFNPSDNTEIRLIADYSEIDELCCAVANLEAGPTVPLVPLFGGDPIIVDDRFSRRQTADIDPRSQVEDMGISGQITIDYDNFTFTSITAFRNNRNLDIIDTDQTSLNLISIGSNDIDIDTFSQEFRFASNGDGPVDWLVGGYYFDESIDTVNEIEFGPAFRPFFGALVGGSELFDLLETIFGLPSGAIFGNGRGPVERFSLDNQSFSVFGQADWNISDSLTATLGLNYTQDDKELTSSEVNDDIFSAVPLAGTPFAGLAGLQFLPPLVPLPNAVESNTTDDDDLTYTLRLAYQLNDATNVYASVGTGFKASSWNLDRGTRPFPQDIPALQAAGLATPNLVSGTRFALPESSEVFEIGLKTRFERGSLNIAIFDQKIEDFQSVVFVEGARFVLSNADEQSTTGAEIEFTYFPTDALEFRIAGTFLDPTFDSFPNGQGVNGAEDLSGQTPAAIHETSISIGATYNFEIGNMAAFIRGDYQFEDEIQVIQNVSADIASREVSQLNVAAGLRTESGWSFSLWGRNITDDEYIQSAFPDVLQPATFNGYLNQPRTYGISARKDF